VTSTPFEECGRVWFRNLLTQSDIDFLTNAFSQNQSSQRLTNAPDLSKFVSQHSGLSAALENLLPNAKPVRIVAFNKSEGNSWSLPWHQDRTIQVNQKHEISGFTNWTKKSGTWHCEPPLDVLENMLFVRIHLDACTSENGPMEIALDSHKHGIIPSKDAKGHASNLETELCLAEQGDVLVLKMNTLHRSTTPTKPSPRRTLRIDFANFNLPPPLDWTS